MADADIGSEQFTDEDRCNRIALPRCCRSAVQIRIKPCGGAQANRRYRFRR